MERESIHHETVTSVNEQKLRIKQLNKRNINKPIVREILQWNSRNSQLELIEHKLFSRMNCYNKYVNIASNTSENSLRLHNKRYSG